MVFLVIFGVPLFLGSNRGSYYAIIYKGVSMVFGCFGRYVKKGSKRVQKSAKKGCFLPLFGTFCDLF